MSKDSFRFKRFNISQDKCAMKVGTDGVLLGAWANLPAHGKIADIGTGTGLLAIMAAQRSPAAEITGIEIDGNAAEQAGTNMANSPWSERLAVINSDINAFYQSHVSEFDCILSNPPYFTEDIKSHKEKRNVARHTDSLSFAQLANASSQMLKEGGNLCVILPLDAVLSFISEAVVRKLFLKRRTDIITKPNTPPKRVLMEFVKNCPVPETVFEKLVLTCGGTMTEEYRALTSDFYL